MKRLIKGARLVDATGDHGIADVLLEAGRIASLSGGDAEEIIEAHGLVLSPGFLDLHIHLREPGHEVKEDLASGLMAAAAGGFTSVVSMPNTTPVVDCPEIVRGLYEKAAQLKGARLLVGAALTQGQQGQRLSEARLLKTAGAVLLTDDGQTNEDALVLEEGLRYAASLDLMVAIHAEDASLRKQGVMNEGKLSETMGVFGNPSAAESSRIARDLEILPYSRGRLHIQHLSTTRGLQLVRAAKTKGWPVSTEVTPHHLTLNERSLAGFDPIYKVSPPLRTQADVDVLIQGLQDGDIDAVATDHAPHTLAEKEHDLLSAPFGIPNIEVAFPLLYTELTLRRGFDLPTLLERFTDGPRRVLGLPLLSLREGAVADLVLFNPSDAKPVEPEQFLSKAKYSPWTGYMLSGWPVLTLVRGRPVYEQY